MRRFLIESADSTEQIAVVEANDELQAFERLMSVQHLLGRAHPRGVEHLNILACLPDEPPPAATTFTDQYFKLDAPADAYTLQ